MAAAVPADLQAAYDAGEQAGRAGADIGSCPYDTGSTKAVLWLRGYTKGRAIRNGAQPDPEDPR